MNPLALVIVSDEQLGATVAGVMREQFPQVVVERVRNEQNAKSRLAVVTYNLVVSDVDIPADETSPLVPGEDRGIQLIPWLVEQKLPVPYILVSLTPDSKVDTLIRVRPQTILVGQGMGFCEQFGQAVTECLSKTVGDVRAGKLNIVISLGPDRNVGTYQFSSEDLGVLPHGPINFNHDRFLSLARRSRKVPNARAEWQKDLLDIGSDIWRQLFYDNPDFYGDFMRNFGRIGDDMGRITICFRIPSSVYAVALEAIASRHAPEDFWMLKASIYRTLEESQGGRPPLFWSRTQENDTNLRCLIIEAPTSGLVPDLVDVDGQEVNLAKLTTAHEECVELERYLQTNRAKFGIDNVIHFTQEFVGNQSFSAMLFNLLDTAQWDLVHFVGHSFYDSRSNKGWLFFPSHIEGDLPERVDISQFCGHLTHARFLYLSTCRSSEETFLTSLARCNIPAAIGFRWEVVDEHATEYALEFYRQLFEGKPKSLQQAFLNTRRAIYTKYANEQIWAAPILMLHSG